MEDFEEIREVRRSPRLNPEEEITCLTEPVTATNAIAAAVSIADSSKNAATINANIVTTTSAASQLPPPVTTHPVSTMLEMQRKIDMLEKQLNDTQVRLNDKNVQYQKLEAALYTPALSTYATPFDTTKPVIPSFLEPTVLSKKKLPNVSYVQSSSVKPTTFANSYEHSMANSYVHTATLTNASSAPMQQSTTESNHTSSLPVSAVSVGFSSTYLPLSQASYYGKPNTSPPLYVANNYAHTAMSINASSAAMQPSATDSSQTVSSLPVTAANYFAKLNTSPPLCLSSALNNSINIPTNELNNNVSLGNFATAPRKLQDLPEFRGEPDDWPIFYASFVQSTLAYSYTNLENNIRLQRAVKGEAREVIKSLLIHPDNVNAAIEQLRFRFGRPEQLIQSQLRQAKELPNISENTLSKLVPFATKVKNLATFLESVNGQQHLANPTLLEELVTKLPMNKRLDWARVAASIQPYPTIVHFSAWVSELANLICTVQDVDNKEQKRRVVLHTSEKLGSGDVGISALKCPLCQEQHKLQDCRRFLNAAVRDRWDLVKKHRVCFSCLNLGHITRNCRRKRFCPVVNCQRKHHSLLHEDTATTTTSSDRQKERSDAQGSVLSCATVSCTKSKLLFRVVPVTLYGENRRIDTHALLDEGSSITMLDSELAKQLGVRGRQHRLDLQWFGGRAAQEHSEVFNIEISGAGKAKRHLLRNVFAVANLKLPMQSLHSDDLKCSDKSILSLPIQPYANIEPKLLIGIDHAHLGLPADIKRVSDQGPYACSTELGWVVFGPTSQSSIATHSCLFVHIQSEEEDIHQLVTDYFNIENIGVRPFLPVESNDDVRARQILEKTTKRSEGRFQTGLLWKKDDVQLPDSYPAALRRLAGIEKKMSRDVTFATAYKDIIKGYINKGYARKLHQEKAITSPRKWFLPHFGVRNPNKPKKLRLVFDAAAQVNGVSLNSELLKGPQQYTTLPSILFNFRRGAVAITADIREMFHQILMQPSDRVAQRFLWRDGDSNMPAEEYEMRVMIFGAACSPCSAQYVMKLNAKEQHEYNPRAIQAITDHHYIDDFVDSFDSVEEAILVSRQVREIHSKGGFELHSFASNSINALKALGGSTVTKLFGAGDSTEKVLGLYWDSTSDCFMFHLKYHRVEQVVISGGRTPTKRELLSIIMSTFDPLGFLSHFNVAAKSLMREVWRRQVRWDEHIPNDVNVLWEKWRQQMNKVTDFRVPRCYFLHGVPQDLELHVFVDASEEAFAAVAYWRSKNPNGKYEVTIVCAKTKCAPLKTLTIPRLELQAAVLGVRLRKLIVENHKIKQRRCVLWSDSRTVLKWIGSEHRRYKPYVAHRIAEILGGSEVCEWRWVPTKDNAADDATRGHGNVDFSQSSRWLAGPKFLQCDESTWPIYAVASESLDEADEEIRPNFSLIVRCNTFIDFNRFSNFTRLKRAVAWALRFINRCRNKIFQFEEFGLTSAELQAAEHLLCLCVQAETYASERNCIEAGRSISKDSKLNQLAPYLDDDKLLRVQGRIDVASYLPYNVRRPIILPYDHIFTRLVVRYHHCQMRHLNHEATIGEIRQKYWIPRLRQLLRSVIAGCYVCRISKAVPRQPIMGPLPEDRVEPYVRPFTYTGLDYFGPISVTVGRHTEKRWIALFTCLTMRAIHLEVAHDLSTDSCIIAMRNFINRRGVPVRLRSDNGKNFIGANEEAKRFSEVFDAERVQSELSTKGVEWLFNCPVNPSEGGVWERMVQCVKKVLRHSLKEVAPREHVLQSFLIEAENIVNSRPLTHLPISPDEEEPLTPNHFLIGTANAAQTPIANAPDENKFGLRNQWRVVRNLRDSFWKRWVLEYLPTLTRRTKWCKQTKPLREGDAVFICDPNMLRKQWRRGVVEKVFTGADGVARRADVRTAGGILQRAVSKLAVLDLECGEAERSTGAGVS